MPSIFLRRTVPGVIQLILAQHGSTVISEIVPRVIKVGDIQVLCQQFDPSEDSPRIIQNPIQSNEIHLTHPQCGSHIQPIPPKIGQI